MTPEQSLALRAAGPHLYAVRPASKDSFALFGFETAPGWYALLLDMTKALEAEILRLPEGERRAYGVSQVKSKFGGLRFYMMKPHALLPERMQSIIESAEVRSYTLCETCGAPAHESHTKRGWIVTTCDEHDPAKAP